jgi:hypothetical protein
MNFNQSKNIFKEWNKHVDNLLTEISDEELVSIEKAIEKAANHPSALPFNDMFGGKLRVVVPIAYNAYADEGPLGQLLNTLVAAGWKVDLNTGLASKQTEREFEGVKRIQTRQMKVNAIWTTFLDLVKKHDAAFRQAYDKNPDLADLAEYTANSPEIQKISAQMEALMGETISTQFVSGMHTKKAEERINEFIKTWQSEAAKIKGKMAEESTYSVLFSRHPIDVLRMSDFKDITSCHAPKSRPSGKYKGGGSYYNCAVAESRDGGAIAYLVKTADVKGVDLTQKFVLSDELRGEQAIDPIARIRLRGMNQPEMGITFAVPEDRVYGEDIKGFREAIFDWVISQQGSDFREIFDHYSEEGKEINLSDFYRFGGLYQDTDVGSLFNVLKDKVEALKDFKLVSHVNFDNTTQGEVDVENFGNLKQLVADEVAMFNSNMEKSNIPLACDKKYIVQIEGDYIYIDPKVYYYYDIQKNEIISEKALNFLTSGKGLVYLQQEITEFIDEKYVSENAEYDDFPDFIRIKLYPRRARFVDQLENADDLAEYFGNIYYQFKDKNDTIATLDYIVKAYIKREGIINGGALSKLNTDVINQDLETDWTLEGDEDDNENPSMVSGEIGLVIQFNEINNFEALKANLTNKKFVQQLKALAYEFPEFQGFDVFFDIDQDFMIYFQINLEENTEDKYVVAAEVMFKASTKESLTHNMLSVINGMFKSTTSAPKQKLQEFKYLNNRWKMFLG